MVKTISQPLRHRHGTISHVTASPGPMVGTVRIKLSKPRKSEREGVVLGEDFLRRAANCATRVPRGAK